MAGATQRATEEDVVHAGRRRFLRGERIDVGSIATELGLGRATVFRWFGDRDHLTSRVMWSLFSDTLDGELARARGTGAQRLVDGLVGALVTVTTHERFAAWLARDPQRALTILTGRESALARGIDARLAELIATDCPEAVGPDVSAEDLAYALRRLAEAYCYADVLAGRPVDVERTRPLFHRLLEGS